MFSVLSPAFLLVSYKESSGQDFSIPHVLVLLLWYWKSCFCLQFSSTSCADRRERMEPMTMFVQSRQCRLDAQSRLWGQVRGRRKGLHH